MGKRGQKREEKVNGENMTERMGQRATEKEKGRCGTTGKEWRALTATNDLIGLLAQANSRDMLIL